MKITILSSILMAIFMSSTAAFTVNVNVNVQRVNVKSMGAQTMALFSEAPASTDSSPAPAPAAAAPIASTDSSPAPATDASTATATKADIANPPVTNQPKYGKELDLPGTYVRCGRCATSYAIAADDLGTGPGRYVLIMSCNVMFVITGLIPFDSCRDITV